MYKEFQKQIVGNGGLIDVIEFTDIQQAFKKQKENKQQDDEIFMGEVKKKFITRLENKFKNFALD